MSKSIALYLTGVTITLSALTAFGAEKYILPVLRFEHYDAIARIEKIEYSINMETLHEKRIQLAKVEKELESYAEPPQSLTDYYHYLIQEVDRLNKEIDTRDN